MSSLFLGRIEVNSTGCEIHALTNNLPFREYSQSEISDRKLFQKLLETRYKILENGQPIFCTAVNPDKNCKIEKNPHDDRDGTFHVVSIDKNGNIISGLSLAVDLGDKLNNEIIGLPLENNFHKNGYPRGASLNEFREKYIRLNYKENRPIQPWEMAEFYRHFNVNSKKNSIVFRLGLYTGCYKILMKEPQKKSIKETFLQVFDAIPQYYNLYRFAGGILRDLTIRDKPEFKSPGKKLLKYRGFNIPKDIYFEDNIISRNVLSNIPKRIEGELIFNKELTPFIDGLVDVRRIDNIIDSYFKTPLAFKNKGVNFSEAFLIRSTLGIILNRKSHFSNIIKNPFSSLLVKYSKSKLNIIKYDF